MNDIIEFLRKNGESNTPDIAQAIDLSLARTRKILGDMDEVEALGHNRNRTYRLKNE